eukprot:s824_g10.t1
MLWLACVLLWAGQAADVESTCWSASAETRCCPEVDFNDWVEDVTFNNFSLASDDLAFSVSIQIPAVLDEASMDWALDIDGSGIWIHVELAVGDLLRYVEKKFSGTFMVDSMTMETDATHLDFGSAQSLTIVRSVDSDGATHRVKWYGESDHHGGGNGGGLILLAEVTYPPGSGSAGPSPFPFALSLSQSGKPTPKLDSDDGTVHSQYSPRFGPGAPKTQHFSSSSATFSRTAGTSGSVGPACLWNRALRRSELEDKLAKDWCEEFSDSDDAQPCDTATVSLDFFCTDQYQPSMPKISRQFDVDPEAVGSTIQIHLMSSALAMLCAGHWIRQRGMRQMILGYCGASSSWLPVRSAGISASSSVAVSAMLTASYADREELRRASNKVACVALIAHIAGPATGGLIAWAFGSYGWQVSFLAVFGLTALNTLASYLLLPDAGRLMPEWKRSHQKLISSRKEMVLMSVNGFIFESSFLLGIRPAALMMSILVASRAFGMLASTTLGFSPVEALNLFSPLLLLAAGYAAVVGALMISDNPLTYMSGLALHQFLAHGPTWAVLAEAQKDPELDDAGLPPHIYAGIMNASACLLSLFGLSAISGGPSAVLYVIAIMSATSQACIRAGSLWAAAKQLFRAQQAFESTSDSDPAPKPPPDD